MKEKGKTQCRSKIRILDDIMQTIKKKEEERGEAMLTHTLFGTTSSTTDSSGTQKNSWRKS